MRKRHRAGDERISCTNAIAKSQIYPTPLYRMSISHYIFYISLSISRIYICVLVCALLTSAAGVSRLSRHSHRAATHAVHHSPHHPRRRAARCRRGAYCSGAGCVGAGWALECVASAEILPSPTSDKNQDRARRWPVRGRWVWCVLCGAVWRGVARGWGAGAGCERLLEIYIQTVRITLPYTAYSTLYV